MRCGTFKALGKPRSSVILQLEPDSSATVIGAHQ